MGTDPILQNLSWKPLHPFTFKMTKMMKQGDTISVKPAFLMYALQILFFLIFAFLCLGFFGNPLAILNEGIYLFLAFSLVFYLVIVYFLYMIARGFRYSFTFDGQTRLYYRGTSFLSSVPVDSTRQGEFSAVVGLQLLQKKAGAFWGASSYELNLVLNDGRRIHVMEHLFPGAVWEGADTLSGFLNVPILDEDEEADDEDNE